MNKKLKALRNLMPMLGLTEIMNNCSSEGCKKPEIKFKQAELKVLAKKSSASTPQKKKRR